MAMDQKGTIKVTERSTLVVSSFDKKSFSSWYAPTEEIESSIGNNRVYLHASGFWPATGLFVYMIGSFKRTDLFSIYSPSGGC